MSEITTIGLDLAKTVLQVHGADVSGRDTARLDTASVPLERCIFRSKPEIALEEIDRVVAAGVRFGCVLADAGSGGP